MQHVSRMQQGDGVQFLFTEFSPYIMHRLHDSNACVDTYTLSSSLCFKAQGSHSRRSILGMNNPGTAMCSS